MKRIIFSLVIALTAMLSIQAQQISVVSPSGGTTLCRSLQAAIGGADPGSIIYLPGGGFPISDEVKITKKLTIIGIGHTAKGDNVDGVTTISGNLWFNEGSSGSAVMGCYITGDVNIGDGGASVNDVLIRYCNLNSVQVKNSTCLETMVNQNYIRALSSFNGSNAIVTNNVLHSIRSLHNGIIAYNILAGVTLLDINGNTGRTTLHDCNQTQIKNNLVIVDGFMHYCFNSEISGNMSKNESDASCEYHISAYTNWNDVFNNYNNGAISPYSDFTFKDDYKQYEGKAGISGGTGFNKQQMAPVPYIVAKRVDEQTDSSGKLNVKIRVKANK